VRKGALVLTLVGSVTLAARAAQQRSPNSFTVNQILGFPSPDNLVASPVGSTIAWTFNERGVRNVYVADGPDFAPRRITPYTADDGQELTSLRFSSDGKTIVYVRGGDHGSGRQADAPDPAGSPVQPRIQLWSVPAAGGIPKLIGDGDDPVVAPGGGRIALIGNRGIWTAPIDGSKRPEAAFFARGNSDSPSWSPDGRTLAFVSNRGDHSLVGLFVPNQPIRFIAPSTSRDSSPAWSPDGRRIAFLRQPGAGGAPRPPLAKPEPLPWAILVADVQSAEGDPAPPRTVVSSGDSPVDPILQNPGGIGFHWAADDQLVMMLYRDGFPHLYAIQHPGSGSAPHLLTAGNFMVEQWTLTPDGRFVIYNANTGPARDDVARRHLFKVPVTGGPPAPLTSGAGIEWSPVVTADGRSIAFLSSDAGRSPLPAAIPVSGGSVRRIAVNLVPPDFPSARLVSPEQVSFRASDDVEAHGQLFTPSGGLPRKPAIVYVHGGGPRQMLLGWHYRWEYANDYGANQLLASLGFIVLSVDYRLSVGYGQAFQFPDGTAARGASEYRDVLAAGRYLQSRPDVDPARIGIWGASLGGYLTALALGRNSDVFAAGVDVHGVHDRLPGVSADQSSRAVVGDGITEADVREGLKVAYQSSPISAVPTWKSPVLLIHGDDDRTVGFHQTVDLRRRLLDKGVRVEELVLPDDVHDSLLWRNWTKSIAAMARFFQQELQRNPAAASQR
jgi:dipeptidyl aminopeptidase/acylaminoacyl peptidase